FLQQRDLCGAAGAIQAFHDDERAVQFAGIETHERLAKEVLRIFRLRGGRFRGRGNRLRNLRRRIRFVLFLVGHAYSCSCERGAKRLRSILEATMSRICFCSLFTGKVPSSTTKLSVSTIRSYSSRMRA